MAIKVAINGYGRIGRNILRALYESNRTGAIRIVAINDLGDAETNAHLTQYDTAHGKFPGTVSVEGGDLVINGDRIKVCAERDPSKLPWKDLGVDVVIESTGLFTKRDKAAAHLAAGARKVIISAPGTDVDGTFVFGVNEDKIKPTDTIISNASCTTNCLAPVAKVMHETFGIVHGLMTTVHSYTNDQVNLDVPHKDLRRARAAAMSQIPTSTGAAKALSEVLPALKGKLDGFAVRVPTPNVSMVDLTVRCEKPVSKDAINDAFKKAAANPSYMNVLATSDEPLVSIDYNGNEKSATVDLLSTMVIGELAKVVAWYDNETGYATRLYELTKYVAQKGL